MQLANYYMTLVNQHWNYRKTQNDHWILFGSFNNMYGNPNRITCESIHEVIEYITDSNNTIDKALGSFNGNIV